MKKKKKRARSPAAGQEIPAEPQIKQPEAAKLLARLTADRIFWLILLGIVAFHVGLLYATAGDPYMQFRVGDEVHYHEWASKIQHGQWARGASFFTTPLYAYFLAFLYMMGGSSLMAVKLVNALLGIGTIILTYQIARRLFDQTIALVTMVLLGFCTAPLFYEWFAEKTSLVLFLTALSFYFLVRATTNRSPWLWLAAGFSVALVSLAHMLFFVMLPSVAVYLVLNRKTNPVPWYKAFLLFVFAFFLGVSPATIHNYLQDRDFVLISSNGGQNFYVSNHAGNYSGTYISPSFSISNIANEEANFKEEAERRNQRAMKPSEVSRFWFRQGLIEIAEEPALALKRCWYRLRWAAGAEEPSDTRTYEFYQERHRILNPPFWGYGLVACLGLVGLVRLLPSRRYLLITSFSVLFIGALSVFFVYGRYRLPLLVPLSILAAFALTRVFAALRERRFANLGYWGLGVAASAWLLSGPVLEDDYQISFFPDYYNQGNKYMELGNLDLAVAEYEKALHIRPGDHRGVETLMMYLSRLYLNRGQFERAETLLQEAAARFPENQGFQQMLQSVRMLRKAPLPKPGNRPVGPHSP